MYAAHQVQYRNPNESCEQRQGRGCGKRRVPSLPTSPSHEPLSNRAEALLEGGQSDGVVDDRQPIAEVLPYSGSHRTTSITRNRRIVVIGDSLLNGTEGPI